MITDTTQDAQIRRSILKSIESMDLEMLKRIAYECRCEELGILPDMTYYNWNWIMNPYTQQLLQKGYTESETRTPSKTKRTYPCTIGLRTFHTEEEYQEALHDFLNGYWWWLEF